MTSARDSDAESSRLREQLAVMRQEARDNEAIHRQTQACELSLLQADSLVGLFDEIAEGLRRAYSLDSVTLVLLDSDHEVRHLAMGERFEPDRRPEILFVDSLAGIAPQFTTLYRSWLGPFIGADHGLLFPGSEGLASIAILPIRRHDHLLGSLNLGSRDDRRYTRHHGSEFLDRLASVTAVCLENAINRARLVRSGITDVLTGMNNRRYLQSRLAEELARAQRAGNTLACVLIDVDHFKRVNDQYGHLAGDRVLREIADRVEGEARASDVAARYGGEEFALLLPETTAADAVRLAERIRSAVADQPVTVTEGKRIEVTVSIGISSTRPARGSIDLKSLGEKLIAEADVQLYRAKNDGRDSVCWEGA